MEAMTMDRGSLNSRAKSASKKKTKEEGADQDSNDDDAEEEEEADEAEDNLMATLEQKQRISSSRRKSKRPGGGRNSLVPSKLTLPSWMKRTSKKVETLSESMRQVASESFSNSSCSNLANSSHSNINLLVQMMQPGMDLETAKEEEEERLRRASEDRPGGSSSSSLPKIRGSNGSQRSNQPRRGSNKSQRSNHQPRNDKMDCLKENINKEEEEEEENEVNEAESDNDESVEEEEEMKEQELLEDSDTEDEDEKDSKKDLLLGRPLSLSVNPSNDGKTNQEKFGDHLMQHFAHLEEDNQSLVLFDERAEEDEEEEEGDDEDDDDDGLAILDLKSSIDATEDAPLIKKDIEGGTISFRAEKLDMDQQHRGPQMNHTSTLPTERRVHLDYSTRPKQKQQRSRRRMKYGPVKPRPSKRPVYFLYGKWVAFCNIIRPREILTSTKNFLCGTFFLLMVPLMGLSWLLFNVLGNPVLQFLPSNEPLAWYVLLVVRWLVTLTLARITQYFLILVTLRTKLLASWAGPFITLMAMQSIGWPFICFSWGTWNLLILHGNAVFCKHWLYFTDISLFSPEDNPDGDNFLESDIYGRILGAMIGVGFVSGLKKTLTALYLSRRMLNYYKPQLSAMMFQMKLVTGVAGLAEETKKPGFATVVSDAVTKATQTQIQRQEAFMDAVPTFTGSSPSQQRPKKGHVSKLSEMPLIDVAKLLNAPGKSGDKNDSDTEDYDDKTDSSNQEGWERLKNPRDPFDQQQESSHSNRNALEHTLATIESWDPPVDKTKRGEPTLHDIVQFRHAVEFMEGDYPFSRAYGLCNCRINCIRSALRVYRRLQKFIPQDEEPTLLYEVIGALAYNSKGEWNEKRAVGLMALFTPDKDNRISRNAFAQACDDVYKKMLFLRASMNNSSKIDGVMEDIFDWFFYGVLAIFVLTLLGLDIWPLLMSFSTMLLSFTFAFSSSTARTVEGIMLIVGRRPFDIGDRITISAAAGMPCPGPGNAWLVEDIDLTTTTLKYLATNEVCTINNSTLTHTRIVNFNRSPKACMSLFVLFDIGATLKQIERFRRRVQKYLRNRPRQWDALVFFRNSDLNKSEGFIKYMLFVRHTQSWQNPAVLAQKAKLQLQIDKIASELKILYVRRPNRMEVEIAEKAKRSLENNDGQSSLSAANT